MTPATSPSERKVKRAVLERDQAREENERLKKSLAEALPTGMLWVRAPRCSCH